MISSGAAISAQHIHLGCNLNTVCRIGRNLFDASVLLGNRELFPIHFHQIGCRIIIIGTCFRQHIVLSIQLQCIDISHGQRLCIQFKTVRAILSGYADHIIIFFGIGCYQCKFLAVNLHRSIGFQLRHIGIHRSRSTNSVHKRGPVKDGILLHIRINHCLRSLFIRRRIVAHIPVIIHGSKPWILLICSCVINDRLLNRKFSIFYDIIQPSGTCCTVGTFIGNDHSTCLIFHQIISVSLPTGKQLLCRISVHSISIQNHPVHRFFRICFTNQ